MRAYKITSLVGLILLFCIFSIESGIFSSERQIPYTKIDNIEWSSFKRLPNYFDKNRAEIYLTINYEIENDSIDIESYMHPFKSYVIFPDRIPAIALEHEKYHFKISELLSRKFSFEVEQLARPFNTKEIQQIYRRICEDEDLIQKIFDLDTKHGQDSLIQSVWFNVIDTLIKATASRNAKYKIASSGEYILMLNKPTLDYFYKKILSNDSIRLQLTYFNNGNIRSEIIYKNGKPDGYYYNWNENGSINQTILYKNGSREGLTVTFNLSGDTIETQYYKNNKIVD
jgi:antitoxin component YwqK of YwqJK toxin-antitoxin module